METIRGESGNLAKILLKKRWSVVFADNEHFITSDKPVGVQHRSREVFGIGTTGAVVSFPLSATRILITASGKLEPGSWLQAGQSPKCCPKSWDGQRVKDAHNKALQVTFGPLCALVAPERWR